jgi:APA family basic amino acid/polyamine antiporter
MQWLKTKTIEQALADSDEPGRQLQRSLGAFDLMILGVAVAVGAGIFSVGARAAGSFAGPAVIFSFILAAATCAWPPCAMRSSPPACRSPAVPTPTPI